MKPDYLRTRLLSKSDEQLLSIVTKERHTYSSEAIQTAESILVERKIEFAFLVAKLPPRIEPSIKEEVEQDAEPKPFLPFVVGVGMFLFSLMDPIMVLDYQSAQTVNITINILFRVIVVIMLINLSDRYKLNKVLWIILGVIFGGWALIVLNLLIWGGMSWEKRIVESGSLEQYEKSVSVADPVEHKNCPACGSVLNGEKNCPACGLSLKD